MTSKTGILTVLDRRSLNFMNTYENRHGEMTREEKAVYLKRTMQAKDEHIENLINIYMLNKPNFDGVIQLP